MGKKKSGFLKEFKEFAMKGNMLDLAVGVIVGGAFKTVVDALTNSVIMMEPVRTYCAALQDDDFTRLQEAIPPAVLNADGFDAGELANVRDSFAKGSSNDYDITPKELDSRRIPESGCRVLEDYFRQQYDWTMTVDEARLVKFRVSFTGELDGQLNVRAVCYQTGGHWYLDLSAVNLNLFS